MIDKYNKAVVLDALDRWGEDHWIGEDDWWFWEIREMFEKLPEAKEDKTEEMQNYLLAMNRR